MVGFSLFPKDSTEIEIRPRLNKDEVAKAARIPGDGEVGMLYLPPNIVGLISYFSPIDRRDHQTGFIYVLTQRTKEFPEGTLIPMLDFDYEIPSRELILKRGFLSGYVD